MWIKINDEKAPMVDSISIFADEHATSYLETEDGVHYMAVGIKKVTIEQSGDELYLTLE